MSFLCSHPCTFLTSSPCSSLCHSPQVRVQQVLADFLLNAIQFTPPSGWVEIKVVPTSRQLPGGITIVKLEFK